MQNKANPSRRQLPAGRQGPLYAGGYHGMMKPTRVKEGQERAEKRAQRTAQQQIAELDARLGHGKGAVRERARLMREIEFLKSSKK